MNEQSPSHKRTDSPSLGPEPDLISGQISPSPSTTSLLPDDDVPLLNSSIPVANVSFWNPAYCCWETGMDIIRNNLGLGGALWFARGWFDTTFEYIANQTHVERDVDSVADAVDWLSLFFIFTFTLLSFLENRRLLCCRKGSPNLEKFQLSINNSLGIMGAGWAATDQIFCLQKRNFNSLTHVEYTILAGFCLIASIFLLIFQCCKKTQNKSAATLIVDAICTIIGKTIGTGGAIWAFYNIAISKILPEIIHSRKTPPHMIAAATCLGLSAIEIQSLYLAFKNNEEFRDFFARTLAKIKNPLPTLPPLRKILNFCKATRNRNAPVYEKLPPDSNV